MNAEELRRRIIEYGADEKGIADRFGDNAELYASCFRDFMDEPNFALLRQALAAKDYAQAFEAAHALKGLSGNLGVTSFYTAVCELVESLRARRYANVDAAYAEVQRQLNRLQGLLLEDSLLYDTPAEKAPPPAPPEPTRKKPDHFLLYSGVGLALFILCIGLLLTGILGNYQGKMTRESANHLIEISDQIKLYIEERIASDWRIAGSVGDSLRYSNLTNDDAAIFELMLRLRDRWQVTDIQIYTESGYNICAEGEVDTNDAASEIAERAMKTGHYMSVADSKIIYTVPVDTLLAYNGSKIVAVSVIQAMDSFMDDMDFSSFQGDAWLYLTEENGTILSKLTNDAAVPAYSFRAIMRDRDVNVLTGDLTKDELMFVQESAVFIMSNETERNYVVSTPVRTSTTPLRLFYLAPVDVVNKSMNSFSRQLSVLSAMVIVVVVAFAFGSFALAYLNRKRRFDKDMLMREHMFDLLVQKTQTAFGLFTVNQEAPDYVSSNCEQVIGEPCYSLDRTDEGLAMRGEAGSKAVLQINERMRDWDGKSEFRSGYVQKQDAALPSYFSLQLFPASGEGQSFVGIMQDVTATFERESAIKNALEMAERSNEAKSRFLSNMSHDIRTPMNAIVNMTNFAIESIDQPKRLGLYLQTIRESSDHLLNLINDVLDMSRIESGQLVVESAPFSLAEEMKRQVDIIKPLCDAKGQTFITDFSGLRTEAVVGDRLKFSQIVMNLLSNAVKFTPEHGAVRFTAMEATSLRKDIVDVRCIIEDNGIGISPENLQHIFEPFNRANDKRVSEIEGTGLGLSICRSYVAAMGGTLRCESEEGEGSVFTVELFFQKADALPSENNEAVMQGLTPFLGMHCLLAEDNATNQLIARTMLERLGFMIDAASDGGEAARMFLHSSAGTYDVVYMDIQMPVMDGYQAAIAIRESDHPQAKTIPIIAMTANVFAEDVEKARIAGMDGHLGKPLMTAKLIEETYLAIQKRKGVRE